MEKLRCNTYLHVLFPATKSKGEDESNGLEDGRWNMEDERWRIEA